jgi:hypothetical protein
VNLNWVGSVWLAVHALAAYRLTRLWTKDELPPLPAMRHHVTERWGNRWFYPLFTCNWCSGFWVSATVIALASSPLAGTWRWLSLALALSAVTGLISDHEE